MKGRKSVLLHYRYILLLPANPDILGSCRSWENPPFRHVVMCEMQFPVVWFIRSSVQDEKGYMPTTDVATDTSPHMFGCCIFSTGHGDFAGRPVSRRHLWHDWLRRTTDTNRSSQMAVPCVLLFVAVHSWHHSTLLNGGNIHEYQGQCFRKWRNWLRGPGDMKHLKRNHVIRA